MDKIKQVKKEFLNFDMSNGIVGRFNTLEINPVTYDFYYNNGFAHIFEEVCAKCLKKRCKCK